MTTEERVKANGGYEWTPETDVLPEPTDEDWESGYPNPDLKQMVKDAVKEALQEWESGVEYLHSPTDPEGRYYCSKSDCEGVRFGEDNAKETSD